MKNLLLAIFITLSFGLNNAWAIDLGSAKSKGLVGETPQGYLAPVGSPTGEVKNLIDSINAQRKAQYAKIAKNNGTSLPAVEKMAGKQAISKTTPGNFVKVNGAWKKK